MATIMITGADGTFTIDGTAERLLTPAEVARMFRVDPRTVTRWAREGRLISTRTPSGQHRFREGEVLTLRGDQADTGG
ncbi:BldC family transcriptional regulator [Streptosporangium sp. NPDC051023]|uniref:BldC family transcriptional regulator n=1 Tax=Streptosporangium sp. NPDC051023 TaxID=3155410 RepID=UPI00344B2A40